MTHLVELKSPAEVCDRLEVLYKEAVDHLSRALSDYVARRIVPTPEQRETFCYPELRIVYEGEYLIPAAARSYGKFQQMGTYATTITEPDVFRPYLLEQLGFLMTDYPVKVTVHRSRQLIPYPYIVRSGDELGSSDISSAEISQFFHTPALSAVHDSIADGTQEISDTEVQPLALFDALRTDFSLRRIVHYTGTPWKDVQPWIMLTNYHRYVDQFLRFSLNKLQESDEFERLVLPGFFNITKECPNPETVLTTAEATRHKFQMPAYHLVARNGQGISLINIGVGPANAKNITDHLAVLRPHCWLMIGHCAGLRQSQSIGDYVLAHAYFRRDRILDDVLPPDIPIPALAEIQVALQEAVGLVTGEKGDALKKRMRTGTVMTDGDRNWEMSWHREKYRVSLSRAIAVDMESGTIAAQGYRFRVPYGTLLCVSDRPLHGEIKLPGAANAFYEKSVVEHLQVGLKAIEILYQHRHSLHSRKLRSFNEPPFR